MSNRDLSLALRLQADASRWVAGLTRAGGATRSFTGAARREFDALKGALGSVRGQLAAVGASVGLVATAAQSARLDKTLTQIGQTAGVSRREVDGLRKDLFRLTGETGQSIENLQSGFSDLVQAGLSFEESAASISAVNKAMAISTATASDLAGALTVAATAFQFDLSKPGKAMELLDKMVVAGDKGAAELNKLPDVFSRIGVNAQSAGFSFEQTLAFVEGLSAIEKSPERLQTLVDSTLRIFNNKAYRDAAEAATGVKFFDQDGSRRDPLVVLRDIKTQFDKFKTDAQREEAINLAFGKADLDTIKSMRGLLAGTMLGDIEGFVPAIYKALGEAEKRIPRAIDNGIDATARLAAKLREAADGFASPINDAWTKLVGFALDSKDKGGLGLSGGQILGGGAALAAGTFAAARYGGKGIAALARRFGGTAAGLAEGKALEAAAGVTPVFVVNWPASMGGGSVIGEITKRGGPASAGKAAARAGWLRSAGRAGLALGPLAAMWGVSEWAGDTSHDQERVETLQGVSGAIRRVFKAVGFDHDADIEARRARNRAGLDDSAIDGQIRITVEDGRVTRVRATSGNPRVGMDVDSGMAMVAP